MSFFSSPTPSPEAPRIPPPLPPYAPVASSSRASSSRQGSITSDSFLSRLEATASPAGAGRRSRYAASDTTGRDRDAEEGMDEAEGEGEGEGDGPVGDVERMARAWVKERGTGDILAWEGDVVDSLFDKLEQQQNLVSTLRSDPDTSEEEHFKLVLVQTEMERVKYLVRSYVRCRLHKIEKYSHHIVLTPQLHPLLSGAELAHAQRYTELLHTHFQHSVLDSLPEWLRKMDDTYGDGLSMVSRPNPDLPVLVYCKRDCGDITLDSGEAASLAKGTTHLVKWRLVQRSVELGWAEVL